VTRTAATLVWAALLVVPFAFLAVAISSPRPGGAPELTALLFWVAILVSAMNIALSRSLPQRLGATRAGREAAALARLLVAWALCSAAALSPLVAYIMTRDPRLIGVFGVDLLALVTLYPSDQRWASVMPETAPGRMVR
jgi:hypothetical protein